MKRLFAAIAIVGAAGLTVAACANTSRSTAPSNSGATAPVYSAPSPAAPAPSSGGGASCGGAGRA
jgi:hypothetical protein